MPRYPGTLVLATAALIVGCDRTPDAITSSAPESPPNLRVVAGNNQTGAAGTELDAPLVVQVTDGSGGPRRRQMLEFRVVRGGGSVSGSTKMTDDDGMGDNRWTLGTRAGEPQQLEVRAVDPATGQPIVTGVFTASVVAGPPASIVIHAGDNQEVSAESKVPTAPAVLLTDQYGNPTADVDVTFAVTAGGGSVSRANVQSDADGIATVDSWTLGASSGTNRLTARAAGSGIEGNPLTFTANATRDDDDEEKDEKGGKGKRDKDDKDRKRDHDDDDRDDDGDDDDRDDDEDDDDDDEDGDDDDDEDRDG